MKYVVSADVFRTILDIYLRMKGVNFTDVLDDDTTLAFLIKLGYKEAIKQSESYQMFIKYSTGRIPPKKSKGKVKRKTSSKKRVKKNVTLSTDDNIISDDPATALELGKSISKTKVEAKAAIQVHVTHARIVIEYVLEPTKRRKSGKVICNPPKKLKEVPNGSTVVSTNSSKGTGTKPGVLGEEKGITEENAILELGSKQESEYSDEDKLDDEEKDDKEGDVEDKGDDHISDIQDTNDEDETKSDEDDIYKYKIYVRKDEDEEMLNDKVKDFDKGDKEVTDASKADAEKTSEVKDDAKKTELPPTSSSLSVSSAINSLCEVKIQSKVPPIWSPSMLRVLVSMISKPKVLTPVQETSSTAPVTTLPPPSVATTPHVPQQTTTQIPIPTITTDAPNITTTILESEAHSVVHLRVSKLEKDVFELKKIDLFVEALAALKTQVPPGKIPELPKKQTPTVDLEKESEKTPSDILKIKKEQAEKQKMLKFTIKSTYKAALKALIDNENAMDKGVADTVQNHKRKHDDDENDDDKDPPAGPNQGKKTKKRRTNESESSKKPSTTKETPKRKASSKGSKT
nr:hypothetical protein [Tanacetum cinerariifolium]